MNQEQKEYPNLSCESVQHRLATQWGYVKASEPEDWYGQAQWQFGYERGWDKGYEAGWGNRGKEEKNT
jgi:hypothetical protein